jgi:hypothetical protein
VIPAVALNRTDSFEELVLTVVKKLAETNVIKAVEDT